MSLPYIGVHPAAEFVERYGDSDYFTTELFDSREAWLEGRKGHLGASDAFKVLDTELRKELFDELTGKRPHDFAGNDLMRRGQAAEPKVRELIAIENPDWDIYDGGNLLFVSKRKPFISASLDCIAINRNTGEVADIELKECHWTAKWKGEYAPDNYFTQVCHQHYVTGFAFCVLHPRIYLTHENGFTTAFERSYEWDMTDPEIQSQVEELIATEEEFWQSVQTGKYKPRLNLASIF